jgi:hypothetical protein
MLPASWLFSHFLIDGLLGLDIESLSLLLSDVTAREGAVPLTLTHSVCIWEPLFATICLMNSKNLEWQPGSGSLLLRMHFIRPNLPIAREHLYCRIH